MMLQNLFKKSTAVKIGIPRKGCNSNKSLPLTNVLVSITKRLFLIQQFFKNFFCKAIFYSFITDFVEQGKKFVFFHTTGKNVYLSFNIFFKLTFYFRRRFVPLFSSSITTSITIRSIMVNFIAIQIYYYF
jgi:hypothetical protein